MITAINGKPVKDAAALRNSIGLLRIGDKVDISLLRDGKPRRVTAVISERDTDGRGEVAAGMHAASRAPTSRMRRAAAC